MHKMWVQNTKNVGIEVHLTRQHNEVKKSYNHEWNYCPRTFNNLARLNRHLAIGIFNGGSAQQFKFRNNGNYQAFGPSLETLSFDHTRRMQLDPAKLALLFPRGT